MFLYLWASSVNQVVEVMRGGLKEIFCMMHIPQGQGEIVQEFQTVSCTALPVVTYYMEIANLH